MLKTRYHAFSRNSRYIEHGYVEPTEVRIQRFVKDTLLFGILIYRETLYQEVVPVWAWAQLATGGSTTWRSECPPDIWLTCVGTPKTR